MLKIALGVLFVIVGFFALFTIVGIVGTVVKIAITLAVGFIIYKIYMYNRKRKGN